MATKHIAVIGSGFSGISAACELARQGMRVTVYEKNESAGGRASAFTKDGFMFDMGPSWYWMPDVFEWFFEKFGKRVEDYYRLERLDPSYRIYFGKNDVVDIPAGVEPLKDLFEQIEPGAASKLQEFLDDAKYKYDVGVKELIYQPCHSVMEFADRRLLKALFSIQLFSSLRTEIYKKVRHPKLRAVLEFPSYFLGALPQNTPALYSILNYADMVLGTWYPVGGFVKVIEGMVRVAEELGVEFKYNSPVRSIITVGSVATGVLVNDDVFMHDGVVSSADYHHSERVLLPDGLRNYNENFWQAKTFAPSCIIFYLGVKGKVKNLLHHNLFFDNSFEQFASDIYTTPKWSENPLFYVCCPSKTDSTVAPEGDENVFVLIPVAPGLTDTQEIRDQYFTTVLQRLENHTGENIRERIVVNECFAPTDFIDRYNSYKANAYGLANTLFQTAVFKPKMRNKYIRNLLYTGQLTVPGPGVPPSLISGHIAANEMIKIVA
ncbi:MAG: phytoene desaturase [Bacteriodetes bacterium]|nr:phytoene desaturase [Bacteroidota bacterium]